MLMTRLKRALRLSTMPLGLAGRNYGLTPLDGKTMKQKLWTTAVIIATVGFAGVAHVWAQNNQLQGHWQLVVANAGDGGNAWKFNPDTGQSYFCYRQNCFAQVTIPYPSKQ